MSTTRLGKTGVQSGNGYSSTSDPTGPQQDLTSIADASPVNPWHHSKYDEESQTPKIAASFPVNSLPTQSVPSGPLPQSVGRSCEALSTSSTSSQGHADTQTANQRDRSYLNPLIEPGNTKLLQNIVGPTKIGQDDRNPSYDESFYGFGDGESLSMPDSAAAQSLCQGQRNACAGLGEPGQRLDQGSRSDNTREDLFLEANFDEVNMAHFFDEFEWDETLTRANLGS